jgi:hypothetical protein
MSLFELGRIVITPMALEFCGEHDISVDSILTRHRHGDWGDAMDATDRQANADALKHGNRIISFYVFEAGQIWIVTEADRSSTCILVPEDY